jgi:hypothetical protein
MAMASALVDLLADGAVAHGPGLEAAADRFDRFHLVQGDGRAGRTQIEQAAQGVDALIVVVDILGVGLNGRNCCCERPFASCESCAG